MVSARANPLPPAASLHGRTCSRIGCGGPAVASFSFDADARLVVLEPGFAPARSAGVLCAAHADRFTAPRGWTLQDRRPPAPSLWADRPVLPGTRGGARRGRSRPARPRTCVSSAPAPALPFDAPVPAPAADPPAAWSPRAEPEAEPDHWLDGWLDARTPLLARAFTGARAARGG